MPTHVLCLSGRVSWQNIKSPRWFSPLQPRFGACDFWLFLKLKSPLKGKRFQTFNVIQENTKGQLMAIGRTVWGPKAPTLKGTEASLSYVQCFSYLVSSSLSVSICHINGWILSGKLFISLKNPDFYWGVLQVIRWCSAVISFVTSLWTRVSIALRMVSEAIWVWLIQNVK